MNDGRNILSSDRVKALREIIEQQLNGAGQVYAIPARGNCKTLAAKAALERAAEQARQIKQHLTETRLTPSTEELLEGVRLPEMPKPSRATQEAYEGIMREAEYNETMRRIGEQAARYQREIESTKREAELAKKRAPIIAVDFDGTLCENKWPEIGAPRQAIIDYCKGAAAAGVRLILWTNRTGDLLAEAVAWCATRELHFDAVNENLPEVIAAFGGDTRKIVADMYIDDKAVPADGLEEMWRAARAVQRAKQREEEMK